MTTRSQTVFHQHFSTSPRSSAFLAGARYVLAYRAGETGIQPHPFKMGTPESDAYLWGCEAGHRAAEEAGLFRRQEAGL